MNSKDQMNRIFSLIFSHLSLFVSGFLLLAIFLFFILRSCATDFQSEPVYRIGQEQQWSEINLLGKQRNLNGFNQALMNQIGLAEEIKIELLPLDSKELFVELDNKKIQGALTFLLPSTDYEQRFIFSNPYFLVGPVLVLSKEMDLEKWKAIPNKEIGISLDSHVLPDLEQEFDIHLRFYDEILSGLSDVSDHVIDGAIFPAIAAHTYVKTFYSDELQIATLPLNQMGIRLVVLNNDQGKNLIEKFNKGLKDAQDKGHYTNLLKQWSLIDVSKT